MATSPTASTPNFKPAFTRIQQTDDFSCATTVDTAVNNFAPARRSSGYLEILRALHRCEDPKSSTPFSHLFPRRSQGSPLEKSSPQGLLRGEP